MTDPHPWAAGHPMKSASELGTPAQQAAEARPLTRRRAKALAAARHALRVPPLPRDFRHDIEGMRAVAVLGVMLWHAGVQFFPGGFTGVDVFFVVSGFLMTSLLLEEASSTGRVRLWRFYARRGRRLLPAALAALAGTAVLTLLVLPRTRWFDVGGDLVASATYLINWRLAARSVDYMDLERAPSPVQHYWSLAVEEQFYIFWPIVLLLVVLLARGRVRAFRGLTWGVTLGLFTLSLGLSWWWTAQDASAYFVTPTRVFELMLGAAVALGARRWPTLRRRVAAVLGWVGLAMVVASLFLITAHTPFPGTSALLPTVGTALVLVAGPAAKGWGPEVILQLRPMQWIGRISYSLYLWHWPFVAVAAEMAGVGRGGPDVLPVHWGLLAVAISVLPAWLSFRYVEEPVRQRGRLLATRVGPGESTQRTMHLALRCTLAGALCGMLLMSLAPTTVTSRPVAWRTPAVVDEQRPAFGAGTLEDGTDGTGGNGAPSAPTGDPSDPQPETDPDDGHTTTAPERPNEIPDELGSLAMPLEQVQDDLPLLQPPGCNRGFQGTDVGICEAGDPAGEVTVVLAGDSHAGMWVTALDEIGRDRGWEVLVMTKSSCAPAPGLLLQVTGQAGGYVQCRDWQDNLSEALAEVDPDVVILSSATYSSVSGDEMAAALAVRVDQIAAIGAQPVLIRDVPRPPFHVPECLLENTDRASRCAFDLQEALERAGTGHEELARLRPELPVLDFTEAICPGPVCNPVLGGVVVWRDTNHLSATYVRSMRDLVEERITPVVLRAAPPSPGVVLDLGTRLGDLR